jgi:membrane protease YdiL (CAAX protease family)
VILFGIVLPAVIMVSYTPSFKYHYPFPWGRAGGGMPVPLRQLLVWELFYAAQFFSLEFFFRGFMLSALRRSMGAYAIFAMVVPYCMIHFGKPLAETLGAFVAGLILGTLALRTRSIWCGVFIHVSVAVSMDMAALLQKGTFPTRW